MDLVPSLERQGPQLLLQDQPQSPRRDCHNWIIDYRVEFMSREIAGRMWQGLEGRYKYIREYTGVE